MKIYLLAVSILFLLTSSFLFAQNEHQCCSGKTEDISGASESDSVTASMPGSTCVVSGEVIGEGQGVSFRYMGNDFNFCCENCMSKFKKEPLDYIKDEMLCPVMGDPVAKDVFAVHKGTKYYLCCNSCLKSFKKDPEKYIN